MDFIHRLVSQDQKQKNKKQKNYRQKTKNLNRTSTYKSHKEQITNHRTTNLDTHIYKHLKPENTGGKKFTPIHKSQTQKDQNTNTSF
jgi:hypothetical protein